MDRRRFVRSVGCAGTLAAATQLPAGASCIDEMMRLPQNRPSAHGMGYVVLDKDCACKRVGGFFLRIIRLTVSTNFFSDASWRVG